MKAIMQVGASGYSLPYIKHQPHSILPNTLPRVQVDKHANPLMPILQELRKREYDCIID